MEKIKDFENAALEADSALRNEFGAKGINMEIHVNDYEKGCKIDVTFFTSNPSDASRVPGACKGD